MALTLYNSLTRSQETFAPLKPGQVGIYYCGVTVYDYCHLGHARACIVWDVTRRYLQWRGYTVRFIQNFTDIDDKILNRARSEGSTMSDVAERFIKAYFEDMTRLNVQPADEYPRATHTIDGIKRLIHELEQKGFAYAADGDVYYEVRKFSEYGKLSGRKLDDMQAGASGRVEVEEAEEGKKRDPFDFALWKGAKAGEPSWESTWGEGRPGWHIECSAMVRDRLGETIDIHTGGNDLIFPHHENEIAQSEAVTGKPLARYWLHNGMVTVNGEKMSKSLGNFITIRELLDRPTEPMAVRLFVLTANYRKPLDFTEEALTSAQNGWNTLKEGLLFGYQYGEQLGWHLASEENQSSSNSDANSTTQASEVSNLEKIVNQWRQTLREILLPFSKSPQLFQQFVTEYKELVAISILLLLTGLPIKLVLGVHRAIHQIPLLPSAFELIGLWVVGRNLLRPNVQENLLAKGKLAIATVFSSKPATQAAPATPAPEPTQEVATEPEPAPVEVAPVTPVVEDVSSTYIERFQVAIDDDLNFAGGLAVLFELAKELRKEGNLLVHEGKTEKSPAILQQYWETLVSLAQVLGLQANPEDPVDTTSTSVGLTDDEIQSLVEQRQAARQAKNFAEADRIRADLQSQGITLIDSPGGVTRWHR